MVGREQPFESRSDVTPGVHKSWKLNWKQSSWSQAGDSGVKSGQSKWQLNSCAKARHWHPELLSADLYYIICWIHCAWVPCISFNPQAICYQPKSHDASSFWLGSWLLLRKCFQNLIFSHLSWAAAIAHQFSCMWSSLRFVGNCLPGAQFWSSLNSFFCVFPCHSTEI